MTRKVWFARFAELKNSAQQLVSIVEAQAGQWDFSIRYRSLNSRATEEAHAVDRREQYQQRTDW